MKDKKHIQVLEDIVNNLNKKGRNLSVHDDPSKDEFIILRIKENNKSIKIPFTKIRVYTLEEGKTFYETPVRSTLANTPYGYTNDKEIKEELMNHYRNNFEVFPMIYKPLREVSKIQENLYHQQQRKNKKLS